MIVYVIERRGIDIGILSIMLSYVPFKFLDYSLFSPSNNFSAAVLDPYKLVLILTCKGFLGASAKNLLDLLNCCTPKWVPLEMSTAVLIDFSGDSSFCWVWKGLSSFRICSAVFCFWGWKSQNCWL